MVKDLLFPKENEEVLLARTKILGYTHIILCYPGLEKNRDISYPGIKVTFAVTGTSKIAVSRLIEAKHDLRTQLEQSKQLLVVAPNFSHQDPFHSRATGFNQVLCKIMEKHKHTLVIFISDLLADQGKYLGRVQQHFRLAKKFKFEILLATGASSEYGLKSAYDLSSLYRLLQKS